MNPNKISTLIFLLVCQNSLLAMYPGNLTYEQFLEKECKERNDVNLLREKVLFLIKDGKNLNDYSRYEKEEMLYDFHNKVFKKFHFTSDGFPLLQAIELCDGNLIELVLKNGADVRRSVKNAVGDRLETAMHLAARKGSCFLMPLLIKYGASVNPINDLLQTPLHLAVSSEFNRFSTVEFLIKNEACLNAKDEDGVTPLMLGAADLDESRNDTQGRFGIIKLLLESGADFDVVDKNGKKVIDYVKSKADKKEYQKILLEHKKQLKLRLMNNSPISFDPAGIIVDYLLDITDYMTQI